MDYETIRDRSTLDDASQKPCATLAHFPELERFSLVNTHFSAVIFDFDGTLGDSMWVWDDIDRSFCEMHGITLPDTYAEDIVSMSFEETGVFFHDVLGVDMTPEQICDEFNNMAYERYAQQVLCKTGVQPYLELLQERGVAIGIATSLSWTLLKAALERNGIAHYFHDLAFCDECEHSKTHSDVYLLAAERLGAKPEECLVFEDIAPGIRSAKSVGMTAGAVLDNPEFEPMLREAADFCISSFDELL